MREICYFMSKAPVHVDACQNPSVREGFTLEGSKRESGFDEMVARIHFKVGKGKKVVWKNLSLLDEDHMPPFVIENKKVQKGRSPHEGILQPIVI